MRVTMLGISGSGKTSYMAGLAQKMGVSGVGGFTISPATDGGAVGAAIARAQIAGIQFANNNFKFPAGTTSTTNWSFDLRKNGRSVCYFDWIDFRGGYVDQLYQGISANNAEEIADFLTYVEASSAIILFVDAIRLVRFYSDLAALEHFTKINTVFQFLTDISSKSSGKNLIVIGTKADSDLIDPSLQKNNFSEINEILVQIIKPLVNPLLDRNWKVAVCSVGAVGVGKVQSIEIAPENPKDFSVLPTIITEMKTFPQPQNVEVPLLYCLMQELKSISNTGSIRLDENRKFLERAIAENNLVNLVRSRITGTPTPKEQMLHYQELIRKESILLSEFLSTIPDIERIIRDAIRPISL